VQKDLSDGLESIQRFLSSLVSGSDEVVNLSDSIEKLNVRIWQYGLFNLSGEVLGYTEKMNQLKELEIRAADGMKQIENGLQKKADIERVLESLQTTGTEASSVLTGVKEQAARIDETLSITNRTNETIAGTLTVVQQNAGEIANVLARSQTSNAEVNALETKFKEFFDQIESNKNKMAAVAQEAEATVNGNNVSTKDLIKKLSELEAQIKDQIQRATGHSLFHSFQTRQLHLAGSKKWWAAATFGILLLSAVLTAILANSAEKFDYLFYLKLSISLPLAYAIGFCSMQYSRERKLEEEYAFKSNISISLVPYKELIEKVMIDDPQEKMKFTVFLIEAVNRVFTPPIEEIFEHKETPILLKNGKISLDSLIKLIQQLAVHLKL
jgi:hypothetical protein